MGGNILIVNGSCNGATSQNTSVSSATDGSGLTLHVTMGVPNSSMYVVTAGGVTLNPGTGIIDSNGNTISENNFPFTDTLGVTALNTSSTSTMTTYTYSGPSGSQSVVFTYVPRSVQTAFGCSGISEYGPTTNNLLDHITLADGSTYSFTYEATPGHSGKVTGRIASVTLPTGGTIAYTYTMNCGDGTTNALTRTLTPGGEWQYVRGGSGNSTTSVWDPASKLTTINFSLNTSTGNTYETQRQVYSDSGGTLMLTTYNCWNNNFTNCATQSVASPITKKDAYTLLSTGKLRLSETSYNGNGLVTEDKEFDWGVNSTGAPSVPPITDTVTTYNTALGNGILNRPSSVVVKNGSGTTVASTTFSYDETTPTPSGATQLASISGSRGNVTTIAKMANGSTTLYQKMAYYDTGTLYTSTGTSTSSSSPGPTTTNTYAAGSSCNGAFPTSIAEPLGLTESMTWNCAGGVIATTTDENSQTTSYGYDNEWRLNQTTYPDGGQTNATYNISSLPSNIVISRKIDSTRSLSGKTILDGFGRTIHAQRTSDPLGIITVDTTYDNWGRVATTTNPYLTTGDPTYGVTTYAYDALNRRTSVTHPDGSVAYMTYAGAAVETQDEGNGSGANRVTRIYQRDGLGRLASVCEVSSSSQMGGGGTPSACGQDIAFTGFLTTYTHDTLGNLLTVTQNGLNGRSYSYDNLSRKISETNPESGTTSYSYDSCSAGDICTRVRPRANQTNPAVTTTTSYAYDTLHRVTQTSYDDGTASVFRSYDTCCWWGYSQTNTNGRLQEEWVGTSCCGSAAQIFSYDAMGRVIQNVQCTPLNCGSPNVAMNYTYDLAGDMTSESNGFGWTYSFSYNTAQELTAVTSSMVDSTHPGSLLSNPQYNALGRVTSATLGNGTSGAGVAETFGYDTRGRPNNFWSNVIGGIGLYGISNITYAPNSNLLGASDSILGGTWAYTYDDFNRVASTNATGTDWGGISDTYAYDRFGNRWQQNVGGTGNPSYVFDANNRIAGSGVIYDAAGNIIADGLGHTYTYDAEGRMLTVDGGTTATYAYDASGRRIEKTTGSTTVYMAYDLSGHLQAEYTSATVNRFEVYQPDNGKHLVTYSASQTFFDLQDFVGSERVKTTQNGNYESSANLPFGDNLFSYGPALGLAGPIHFTGMNTDSETGLSHAWFRQYSPTQGRWMTPDPSGMGAVDPTNPQSWNQYAYVMNNPTNFIDLVGLECYAYDGGGNCTSWGGNFGNLATMGGFADPFQMGTIPVWGPTWMPYTKGQPIFGFSFPGPYGTQGSGLATFVDGYYLGIGPIGNGFDSLGIDWGWWGSFAKSFVNPVEMAKTTVRSFKEGGCDNLMFSTFAEDFNPLPGDGPGVNDAAELAPKAIAAVGMAKAVGYGISNGLTVPLRSSTYRGLRSSTFSEAAEAEDAIPELQFGYATGDALLTAGHAAYNGQCF